LAAFCFQAFRYGRGRAQQIKVYPCLSDVIHLAPAFFVAYLLALFSACVIPGNNLWLEVFRSPWTWIPFGLFTLLSIGTGISAASWHRRFTDVFKVPILILYRHTFYGIGLVAGFLTNLRHPDPQVKIFQVKWTKNSYELKPLEKK
jgi:hypothetical protein